MLINFSYSYLEDGRSKLGISMCNLVFSPFRIPSLEQAQSWSSGWWLNSVTCAYDSDLSVSIVEVIGQDLRAIQSSLMVYNGSWT